MTDGPELLEIRRHDVRYPFLLRNHSADVPTYRQVFVSQGYDFLVEQQPRAIVDAGAHIGLASIYFANRYPRAKIIAVEPDRSNFDLLKRNVAPYGTIIPVPAALWNRVGNVDLIDPGLGNWGFMTEEPGAPEKLSGVFRHTVAATTVDKIIDGYELERIDILKIDIEGAEKEVFADTTGWIEKVDGIIIELHERLKRGCCRSFFDGSRGFAAEWTQGENVYLSKGGCMIMRPQLGQGW